MPKKNKESIENNREKYEEYFQEDLAAIEEELDKSKGYSEIIDRQISILNDSSPLGGNRGNQHYLIEHIKNAVELQTQRQGLRRDRFTIKKAILEYSLKTADEDEGSKQSLQALIEEFLKKEDENKNDLLGNEEDIDSQIDKQIENMDKD